MHKPRIFIGSSSEALETAKLLQTTLSEWSFPEIWTQGMFNNTNTNIENLVNELPNFDYCILLVTADDISEIREKEYYVPRDNVIFELGLSIGCLGRDNTFMVQPCNLKIKLPSDLLGTNPITYDYTAPNLVAELGVVSTKIKNIVKKKTII